MSVNTVVRYSVSCDGCGRTKLNGDNAALFYSYQAAVSLAKLDGWVFTDCVLCPECVKESER